LHGLHKMYSLYLIYFPDIQNLINYLICLLHLNPSLFPSVDLRSDAVYLLHKPHFFIASDNFVSHVRVWPWGVHGLHLRFDDPCPYVVGHPPPLGLLLYLDSCLRLPASSLNRSVGCPRSPLNLAPARFFDPAVPFDEGPPFTKRPRVEAEPAMHTRTFAPSRPSSSASSSPSTSSPASPPSISRSPHSPPL
jgi:hypothetical protein